MSTEQYDALFDQEQVEAVIAAFGAVTCWRDFTAAYREYQKLDSRVWDTPYAKALGPAMSVASNRSRVPWRRLGPAKPRPAVLKFGDQLDLFGGAA